MKSKTYLSQLIQDGRGFVPSPQLRFACRPIAVGVVLQQLWVHESEAAEWRNVPIDGKESPFTLSGVTIEL